VPAQLTEFDRAHVDEILSGHGSWFSAHLLRLCAKADSENLAQLALAYPDHVAVYLKWKRG